MGSYFFNECGKIVVIARKCNLKGESNMIEIFKINIDKEQLKDSQKELKESGNIEEKLARKIQKLYDDAKSGYFDGTKMQEVLFPEISQTNIFLSHSYSDIGKVLAVKREIEKSKGANVFIDSLYWDSVYKAQKYLTEKLKYDDGSVLKNLHIIITTAIAQMIQSSKYFLFLESKNSISGIETRIGSVLQKAHGKPKITQSPWIYYELQIAKMLERQKLPLEASTESHRNLMKCFFDVEDIIDNMKKTRLEDFIKQL